MRRWLRNNGLAVTLLAIFVALFVGQSVVGWHVYNQTQREQGMAAISYAAYTTTPSFMEATFENWESEFLQLAAFALLSTWLFQKGSAGSRDPDAPDDDEALAARFRPEDRPWPVRRGGLWLALYENSLVIVFVVLFAVAFVLHAIGGAGQYNAHLRAVNSPQVSTLAYLTTAQFWYESLQNWESEFMAVFAVVVLTIFLRQKGSPISKPVEAPHDMTGT